ncbi:MAG: hypothetical protein Q4A43_01090 [Coriobacteriia bacterium]|nr:hypothetical protein [Coriobacteriia bacterium]
MDRDSMFGLTEEDYGYDDDDEAFEQYGLFTSSAMFSGAGYKGYSGADVVTKPSMAAAYQQDAGGSSAGGYMTPEMALEQAAMAHEEAEWAASELAGARLVNAGGGSEGATSGLSSFFGAAASRDASGMSEEDYWADEDEQALLFGFGEF